MFCFLNQKKEKTNDQSSFHLKRMITGENEKILIIAYITQAKMNKTKKNHRYYHLVSSERRKKKEGTVYDCLVEKQLNRSRKARVIFPGRR